MNDLREEEAKISVMNKAKLFLNEVKKVLNIIESDLDNKDEKQQIIGSMAAAALSHCFNEFPSKLKKIHDESEKENFNAH